MARAFVAIVPPLDTRATLVVERDELAAGLRGWRWVADAQLHLTLAFFGDADLDQLANRIDPRVGTAPFELTLRGIGAFPRPRAARVLWSGVCRGRRELDALARSIDASSGHARDERFRPHLTLARSRTPHDVSATVRAAGIEHRWLVTDVVLFESVLGPDGAQHRAHTRWAW